jgi:hypothetical protein
LDLAIIKHNEEAVQILRTDASASPRTPLTEQLQGSSSIDGTEMHMATDQGDIARLRQLIDAGGRVNAVDAVGIPGHARQDRM